MTHPVKDWRALLRTPRSMDADAVWAGVEARRGRRRVLRWAAWGVPLAAAVVVVLFLVRGGPGLERKDGGSLAQLEAAAQPAQFLLSDGSQIELAAGARLETRSLTGQLFASEVRAGKVTFDVVPNGPRVWEVTAGTTQVRVLGTRFSVQHNAQGVQVSVARGRVLVTGPEVPGGSQELQAGHSLQTQSLRAHAPQSEPTAAQLAAAPDPPQLTVSPTAALHVQPTAAEPGAASGLRQVGKSEAALALQPAAAKSGAASSPQPAAADSGAASERQQVAADPGAASELQQVAQAEAALALRQAAAKPGGAMEPPRTAAKSGRAQGARPAFEKPLHSASPVPSIAAGQRLSSRGKSETAQAAASSVERSLREADRAREQGQPERAAKLLSRVIAEYPHDARAALAAFTLGELYLGPLASPLRAATAFERAQKLGLPSALAEQGAARIFEAYGAAAQRGPAAAAARAYLTAYPEGSHRRAAERWVSAQ